MIFIANNTREIEKNNNNLKIEISKIKENLKINRIELITHQNSSYLKKLYKLYNLKPDDKYTPNIVSIEQISKKNQNLKLVNTKN